MSNYAFNYESIIRHNWQRVHLCFVDIWWLINELHTGSDCLRAEWFKILWMFFPPTCNFWQTFILLKHLWIQNRSYPIVVSAVDVSWHSEVSNFHEQPVAHQAVACRQVTVHKVLRRQVDHPWCDLSGYVQHLRQTQFPIGLKWLSVNQDHCIWTVSSVSITTDFSSVTLVPTSIWMLTTHLKE